LVVEHALSVGELLSGVARRSNRHTTTRTDTARQPRHTSTSAPATPTLSPIFRTRDRRARDGRMHAAGDGLTRIRGFARPGGPSSAQTMCCGHRVHDISAPACPTVRTSGRSIGWRRSAIRNLRSRAASFASTTSGRSGPAVRIG
jgi:hypothetical protein